MLVLSIVSFVYSLWQRRRAAKRKDALQEAPEADVEF
jgi:hypothetical protein